jgi:hypothetical protein
MLSVMHHLGICPLLYTIILSFFESTWTSVRLYIYGLDSDFVKLFKSSTTNAYISLIIRLIKSNGVRWDTKPYSGGETTNVHKILRETWTKETACET